jgi:hypothetical protein
MRMAAAALISGCLLCLLGGCGDSAPASPLAPRLDAAKAVSDPAARDKELVALALDAGKAGDIEVANASLDAIANDSQREQTKVKVILRLAKAGKVAAAYKLEATVADAKARERLYLKIRNRDFSE